MMKTAELQLTREWDKTFPKSDKVEHRKVCFVNHFGITLAGDLYSPEGAEGKLPALAVCGPFGACKEQSSGLYAQTMAERGFVALAFDPSFTGESGGFPRAMHSPDLDVEDFQAAVDYLSCHDLVDAERIGIIGICGWGGMALQTACIDTRVKATVTSTMYDMSRVAGNGYFDAADSEEARHQARLALNAQRTLDYQNGDYARAGGVVDPLPEDAPFFVKDYYDYYKTPRGYHPPVPELQRGLDREHRHFPHEHAAFHLRQGDPRRGADDPRGEGPLLLSEPGHLRRHGTGQQVRRQQGADDHPRRRAHRPL